MALIIDKNVYLRIKKASRLLSSLVNAPSLGYVSFLLESCKSYKQVNGLYVFLKNDLSVIKEDGSYSEADHSTRILLTGVVQVLLDDIKYDDLLKEKIITYGTVKNRYIRCEDTLGIIDPKFIGDLRVPDRDTNQTLEYYENLLVNIDDLIDYCVMSNIPIKADFFYQLLLECYPLQYMDKGQTENPFTPNIDSVIDTLKPKLKKNLQFQLEQALEQLTLEGFNETSTSSSVNASKISLHDSETASIMLRRKSTNEILEDEDVPSLMVLASSLFDSVWKDKPDDMKNPTKPQLMHYIKTKQGIVESEAINALIRISRPDKVRFGGKQNPNLKEWKPKGERN
jgi:hypothetical protein